MRYMPLPPGHIITSPFGPRDGGFHAGTDFGWPGGSGRLPVYAVQSGTVIYAGAAQGYGGPDPAGWLVVDSTDAEGGGCVEYGHIVREVRLGQQVTAGERIAHINPDTGTNGGVPPHLHLSVMPHAYDPAAKIDPLTWLVGAGSPTEIGVTMPQGLDFAGGRPGARAIRDAGFQFVVRYLSDGGPGLPGKQLLPEEAADYQAHGIEIVSNWETTADRMRDGYLAGVQDATAGLAHVLACGGPADRPIYFSADWDASEADQEQIDAYLRGAATVIGPDNVGIYGGYWPVSRALDHGTARWVWQAEAWSGGNFEPRAQLIQRNSAGYAVVGGVQCDQNEATTADYGQWSLAGTRIEEAQMSIADDELGKLFPSRSIYRDNGDATFRLAAFISDNNARIHEAFVAEQALRGVQTYIDIVTRVARDGIIGDTAGFGYPELVAESKARAQAVLDQIASEK